MSKCESLLLGRALISSAMSLLWATAAVAGDIAPTLPLPCEIGRSYPICAVSEAGEVVTGHLAVGPGRGLHMRLMPMGIQCAMLAMEYGSAGCAIDPRRRSHL